MFSDCESMNCFRLLFEVYCMIRREIDIGVNDFIIRRGMSW